MPVPGKLITAMGLALIVALSGCGDGKTSDGKTSAATEAATPRTSSSASTSAGGTKTAPKGTETQRAPSKEAAGQVEKTKAPPKQPGKTKAQGPRPGYGPDTRDECVDYVNGLVIQDDDRAQLLALCRQYPR